jgi:hypothetical protein
MVFIIEFSTLYPKISETAEPLGKVLQVVQVVVLEGAPQSGHELIEKRVEQE